MSWLRCFGGRAFLLLIILVGTCASRSQAQTLPAPTADDQLGMLPYQSYHGGDIDAVSLSTGGLSLNLPVLVYPQRGKLHLSFNLFYNNEWQHLEKFCPLVGSCMYIWGFSGMPSPLPLERSDAYIGNAQQFEFLGTTASLKGTDYTEYWDNWSLQTADGGKHPLGNLGTMTEVINVNQIYWKYGGPFETLDATAWKVNGTFTSGAVTWYNLPPTSVIDADGVLYDTSTTFEEDPNGNKITEASGTVTDSLNRQIPLPPTSGSSSNTSSASCPQPPQVPLPVAFAVLWSPPGPNGANVPYTFCYATVAYNIPPNLLITPNQGNSQNFTKLQSIVLPNSQTWNFVYNDPGDGSTYNGSPINYGTLTQITLPTGGTISYSYTSEVNLGCGSTGRWVTQRTLNANDGTGPHSWNYSYAFGSPSTTTVTDPVGNYAVHTFGLAACTGYETQTQYYQNGGTLLKTLSTAYSSSISRNIVGPVGGGLANVVPAQITTAWANGQTAQVAKTYDSGYTLTDYLGSPGHTGIYGKALTEAESDYGQGSPGSVLRTTTNTYQALSSSTYLANNLLNLPASVKVTGGSQTAYATYGYDESARVSSGISTQLDSSPPTSPAFGNQTSVHRQLNNGSTTATSVGCPAVSSGGYLVSNVTYFDTGMADVAKDPCAFATAYAYSSTYAGAFPTTITNAAGQSNVYTYDFNTGLLASIKDPNLQTTSFTYDNMWRLASATYPDGGSAVVSRQETSFPNTATLTKKITTAQNYATTNVFDGVGRVSESQLTSDTPATTYTVTVYDALGRKGTIYNPTRCNPPTPNNCGESTWGYSTFAYDGLSRIKQVTQPDGSTLQTSYTGNSTTVTDEAGKKRTTVTDGLGRLSQVFEDPSVLNYETVYQYDALDDLTNVTQNGSRQRAFAYDSLKRLTSANNPESGTVTYTYDADGNAFTKLDARSIKTTYTYDNLNRAISKTYTDSTPTVTYAYDGNTPVGCSTGVSNYGLAIGRRTAMCDNGTTGIESWTYNDIQNLGWQTIDKRTTGTVTKSVTTQDNLAGSLAYLIYPSGRTITYADNGAIRPISAQDVTNGISYGSNGLYAPPGELNLLSLGTSVNLTNIFNSRLQPCWTYAATGTTLPWSSLCTASATTGNIIDLKYNLAFGTADNGNVVGIVLTGLFCTSRREREFTRRTAGYAKQEVQSGTDRDVAASD